MKKNCVFLFITESYIQGGLVAIYSFLKHNQWFCDDIIISYIEGSIKSEDLLRFKNLYDKTILLEISPNEYDNISRIAVDRTYFIGDIFKKFKCLEVKGYDKLVLLDADVLVTGDIKELFDTHYDVIGVVDNIIDGESISMEWRERYGEYFNSGILVFNDEGVRHNLLERVNHINEYDFTFYEGCGHCGLYYPDQDIFNVFTSDLNVGLAPQYYNFKAQDVNEYNVCDMRIIHYYGQEKPWNTEIKNFADHMWEDCLNEIMCGGPFYELDLFGEIHHIAKNFNDRDKYVVCTCAKNENDYIEEWVNHYLDFGFDKIIICDNNEVGDYSLYHVLQDYVENGTVEILNCRGFGSFQVQFYSMFCREGNYKWCAYYDCDEFLVIPLYDNIKEYLATKENEICISFNWLMYGSNGEVYKTNSGVQERFKNPISPISLFTENSFVKSIVRGGDIFRYDCWFNGSHIPTTNSMFVHNVGGYYHTDSSMHMYFPPRYKEGYIKHYYTKSFAEWMKKRERGWPDGTDKLTSANYFICQDWADLPLDRMADGLFCTNRSREEVTKSYNGLFETFHVIKVVNPNRNIYAFILGLYNVFRATTNHTFLIEGNTIDDTTFNMLLEYAIRTGNRLLSVNSDEETWKAYLKYRGENDETYYILNFT
jgi:lipopolysaccharide biosynthesis glycosyltransferase